jgi:integrase
VKLADAFELVGSTRAMRVGHRVKRRPDGSTLVCKPWYATWTEDGRPHYQPLKTANKALAIKRAMEIDRRLAEGLGLVPRQVSVDDLVTSYMTKTRGQGRADSTIKKYKSVLDQFATSLSEEIRRNATKLHEDPFWAFSQKMIGDGRSEHTRIDRLTIVKQLTKHGAEVGLLARNPFRGCRLPEPAPTPQPCFTPMQVGILLSAAEEPLRTILFTLLVTGIRFGELAALRWDRVDFHRGFVTIDQGGSGGRTKGRRARSIPLHPDLLIALTNLPRRGELVFYQQPSEKYPDGSNPLDERRLLRTLKRLCGRAGLEKPEQYKLHTCRHTFASMLARHNVSYKYALEFMGHTESRILDLYYTMFDEDAAKAILTIQYPLPPNSAPDTRVGARPAA